MFAVPRKRIDNTVMENKLRIGVKNRLGFDYVGDMGIDMIDEENYTPERLKEICEEEGGMNDAEIADVYEVGVDWVKYK